MASEATGEVLFEVTSLSLSFSCSDILAGTVTGGDGVGSITKVLSLEKMEITLEKPLETCTADPGSFCLKESDIRVAPEGLPWPTLIFLMGNGLFLQAVFGARYEIMCLVALIGEYLDECSMPSSGAAAEVLNVTGGVEAMGAVEPKIDCSPGGAGSGLIEEIPGNLIKDGTKTLEVSSTG